MDREERFDAPVKAPAIGYSIVMNLGGDRQFTAQCFVDQDEDQGAINAKVDKVLSIGDRLRARYALPDHLENLDKHERTLANFRQDLAKVDAEHAKNQALKRLEISELENGLAEENKAGYDEHVAAGRKGPYTPRGHREAAIKRIGAAIAQAKEQLQKADAERDVAVGNLNISVKRYEKEIEIITGQIERCKEAMA